MFEVAEILELPLDRINPETGKRESLVCYYKPEDET